MKIIYRITLALALFNALSTAAVAFVYYVVARPEWSDTAAWGQVEATLRDPGTSAEVVRKIALDTHELISGSMALNDLAIQAAIFTCGGAAICLAYIGFVLRARVKNEGRAL